VIFSSNQINDLLKIVEYQHLLFIGKNVGTDILTNEDKTLLRSFGIDIGKITKENTLTEQGFKFGLLAEAIGDERTKDMKYKEFTNFLKSGKFIPLTEREKDTLQVIKTQSYSAIKGLGDKIKQTVRGVILEEDTKQRAKYEEIIREEAERVVIDRESLQSMVSEIGKKTGDWDRDLGRIVETEMHNSYEQGRAASLERKGGKNIRVYKDVFPGSCRHCIRLYLTAGVGSQPIIFKLSELRANGNNVGRKPQNWKAVIQGMHPFCRCTLNYVPEGYEWNEQSRAFSTPIPYKRKVARKAKIKVTIGEEKFQV